MKDIYEAVNNFEAFTYNNNGKCTFVRVMEEQYEDVDLGVLERMWKPLMDAVKKSGYRILKWNPTMELKTNVPYKTYIKYCDGGHSK